MWIIIDLDLQAISGLFIMEIPSKISILHRRLGLCKPVEHKNLIVLLYKYPLPAIERARLKMKFRKQGLFVRMAVEDM